MIGLVQRVTSASVDVDGKRIAEIATGMLVLVGVTRNDTERSADKLAHRLCNYRIFNDSDGKMNLSVNDTQGGILLVPQFTLAAETHKGMRPGFSRGAPPQEAQWLFDYLVAKVGTGYSGDIGCGRFGADMQVSLVNDGPVTFWLET